MAIERVGNIFAYEVQATDDFAFPTIADMTSVAGGSTVTQDINIVNLGVPAIALADIMNREFEDASGNTALPSTNPLAGIISVSALDLDTIRVSLDPSAIDNADADTEYSQLFVSQAEPGD